MKILPIFRSHLYAVSFDNEENELDKLINFWTDTELLFEYFNNNNGLQIFSYISNDEAIMRTTEYAELVRFISKKPNKFRNTIPTVEQKIRIKTHF